MATPNKETIYIDVDDEITSIIDKVKSSKSKIVALVLPKRSTVLQSVVNMKLIKKAAQTSKKSVVLITNETSLMPLAGVAGLHIAKSLQSKPVIPPPPAYPGEDVIEAEDLEDTESLDTTATVGALAAAAAAKDEDAIELATETIDMSLQDSVASKEKLKKKRHLKVPNFDRFRVGIFLAGLAVVLLVVGWYFAAVVMPRAQVTIRTTTTSAVSSFDFTVTTAQTELDKDNKVIPAIQKTITKSDNTKVPATGQKDLGAKAEGTMTMKNCSASDEAIIVSSGTRFSAGDFAFISTEAVSLPASSFSGGGTCTTPTRTVDVLAEKPGDSYNLSARAYTVGINGVTATGSAMAGGSTKIVKVVSQKDVDDAVADIKTKQDQQAGDELKTALEIDTLFALSETRASAPSKITTTPNVDSEAEEATVLVETTYTMLGIQRDYLSQLIKADVEGDPSLQGQAVTDDGIDTSIMRLNNQQAAGEASISFRTSVTAGPEIDEQFVKESIKGKKRGEAEAFINGLPGVDEATVDYSPFWVYTTPKSVTKINVVIEKVEQSVPSTENNE
jgi:hypothetical protein